MGINKPQWKYLLQEEGCSFRLQLEDGNGLFDEDGDNAYILLEESQQIIGCKNSPLLSIPILLMILEVLKNA